MRTHVYKTPENRTFRDCFKYLKQDSTTKLNERKNSIYLIRLETTGLDIDKDEICAISYQELISDIDNDWNPRLVSIKTFHDYIKTNVPISNESLQFSPLMKTLKTEHTMLRERDLKDVITDFHKTVGNDAYICGFGMNRFIYPFLKKSGFNMDSIKTFDIKTVAESILPKQIFYGVDYKSVLIDRLYLRNKYKDIDFTNLSKSWQNLELAQVTILSNLYSIMPLSTESIPNKYVSRIRYTDKKTLIFTTQDGEIELNCSNGYFYGFDSDILYKKDMDAFTDYILRNTKSETIETAAYKLINLCQNKQNETEVN